MGEKMKKILYALCRTLGDCIISNTIIEEIKKKYPDSDITWAIWPQYSEIADTNPNVKSLFLATDWNAVLREMSSGKYDLVLCPYMTNHTDTIWHQVEKYKHGHLLDYYAKRCNTEITYRREYMYPTEGDYKVIMPYIEEGFKIVVHTTSLVPSKDWPGFQELINRLGGCVLQIGGPNDKLLKEVGDLRGKLTYNQIAALLDKADLFIGIDSGLAYIASAMNCPNIVIMGMSTGTTSGPIGKNTHFIEPKRPCEWPCHCNCSKEKEGGKPCINSITVDTVLAKIKEVLENGKKKESVVPKNKPGGNKEGGGKEGSKD